MPHITPILGIIFTGLSLGGGAYAVSKYLSSNKNKEVLNNDQKERNSRQVIKVNDGGENTPKEKDILWELYYKGKNDSIPECLGSIKSNEKDKKQEIFELECGSTDWTKKIMGENDKKVGIWVKGNNESIDEVLGMELKNKDYKSNKFWEKNKGLEDLNGNGCDFVSENGEAKINCDLDLLEE